MDKLDPELMFELHPVGWDDIIPSFLREGPDFAARPQGVCVGGFSGQGPSEMPEKRTRMIRFVICKCGSRWRISAASGAQYPKRNSEEALDPDWEALQAQ